MKRFWASVIVIGREARTLPGPGSEEMLGRRKYGQHFPRLPPSTTSQFSLTLLPLTRELEIRIVDSLLKSMLRAVYDIQNSICLDIFTAVFPPFPGYKSRTERKGTS